MAQYKLTYFDFSGSRGEECRLALFLNDVDFEDHRIDIKRWPDLKSDTPYGSLPLLEADGRPTLAHSNAILSFIGRTFGHHPSDPWEAARHEGIFAAVEDYRAAAAATSAKDDDEKKRLREEFAKGYLQRWATSIEAQIEGPFVAGDTISLADVKINMVVSALMSGTYDHIPKTIFDDFPKIQALHDAVDSHPKVAAWRAKHAK